MNWRRHPSEHDAPQRRWVVLGLVLALHVVALAAMFLAGGAPRGVAGDEDRSPAMVIVAVADAVPVAPAAPPSRAPTAPSRAAAIPRNGIGRPQPVAVAPPLLPAAAAAASVGAAATPPAAFAAPVPTAASARRTDDATTDDALAAYRQQLWRKIRAHRPYGTVARGTVAIGFRVRGDGALLDAWIAVSSGDPALDRIGLRTVRKAAPFPSPPAGAAPPLAFVVPLDFR